MGNKRVKFGTFTNTDTDSGGAITTGLKALDAYGSEVTSHTDASKPKNTVSGGTLTLVTDNGVDGLWWAIGV